jgi:hypothetical protein
MRTSKSLALAIGTSLTLLMTAPSHAQNNRDHRDNPTSRDHRANSTSGAQGGVAVTSTNTNTAQGGVGVTSGRKKRGSECVRLASGGPCLGGKAVETAKDYKKNVQDKVVSPNTPTPNRDHRTPRRMTGDSGLPR